MTDMKYPSPKFRALDTLADPDGLIARVTENVETGRISFAIFREFERNGATEQTTYMQRRHIDGIRRLLDQLEGDLERHEDQARARLRRGEFDHA